jgi:signal transduction histidine kinase
MKYLYVTANGATIGEERAGHCRVRPMIDGTGTNAPRVTWSRVTIWITCLLVVLTAGIVPHGFFETSSNSVFDAYQRLAPQGRLAPQIVVVDIDDESLRRIGQWPWRRDQLARLIDHAAGARVVGLDILLTEPDRLSPEALLADWPNLAPAIKEAVSALPQPDAILARSMAAVPVVLAAAASTLEDDRPTPPVATTPIFEAGDDPRPGLPRYGSVAWPLPDYVTAARGIGLVSTLIEPDGVTRRIPAVLAVGPALMPSFAVEVLRVATHVSQIGLRSGPAGIRELEIGDHRVEIDAAGRAWPQLGKHMAAQSVSAYRVLDGEFPPSLFRDRIVLIGAGAAGLGDVIITPLGHAEPAIVAQAQFIDSVMAGDMLWRPPAVKAAEALLALTLGAAALVLLGRVADRPYGILFGGIALVMVLGSFVAFQTVGLLLDWTFPLAALVATMIAAFVLRIGDEARARRWNERQLTVALLKAEAADRAKTEFLANASHELRTPLTAILGFSEIMSDQVLGPLSPRYAGYARDIYKTATHLHAIITDILDLVVIDLGGKEPADDRVDVAALVTDCAHLIPVNRGVGDKIRVTTELAAPLPPMRADARMVKQMLVNLLSNAVKHSPRGGEVAIRAEICPDGGLGITVRDSGPGIAATDIAYAMQPFGRLRSSKLAQAPGIGIGLPLTKSMVELHGGRLMLNSEVGVGTEALLWFPPTRLAAAQEPARLAAAQETS